MESAILRIMAEQAETEMAEAGIDKQASVGTNNPVMQVMAAQMMQNPPMNMGNLMQLYAQKLEKDLRQDLEQPTPEDDMAADPLYQENKRLRRLTENMRMKLDMIKLQRRLAGIQGEMAMAMGMQPNPAAAAAGQGMPGQEQAMPPQEMPQEGAPPEGAPPAAPAQAPAAAPAQGPGGMGPVEAAAV